MTSKLEHVAEFDAALAAWTTRAQRAAREALIAAAAAVADETKASFGGGAAAPQSRSGRLADSVRGDTPVETPSGWTSTVGPAGVPYARRVELGKSGRRHAGPHPYFRPGFKRAGSRFVEIFHAAWTAAAPGGR